MWNFWPWQKTERERELEGKIAQLEAQLEAQLFAAEAREEALALVLEQQRICLMSAVATAKNGALAQGVPLEFFEKAIESRPPAGPYEQAAVGAVTSARQRSMNGYSTPRG